VQHTAKKCNTLQSSATHCHKLYTRREVLTLQTTQHTAAHGSRLQPMAAHRDTLQHTINALRGVDTPDSAKHATNCNTLQHTATHCNTLLHNIKKRAVSRHFHTLGAGWGRNSAESCPYGGKNAAQPRNRNVGRRPDNVRLVIHAPDVAGTLLSGAHRKSQKDWSFLHCTLYQVHVHLRSQHAHTSNGDHNRNAPGTCTYTHSFSLSLFLSMCLCVCVSVTRNTSAFYEVTASCPHTRTHTLSLSLSLSLCLSLSLSVSLLVQLLITRQPCTRSLCTALTHSHTDSLSLSLSLFVTHTMAALYEVTVHCSYLATPTKKYE